MQAPKVQSQACREIAGCLVILGIYNEIMTWLCGATLASRMDGRTIIHH